MHTCSGLGGLTAPMIQVPTLDTKPDARHLVLEREDYVGQSGMSHIMAIHTDHGDGSNDRTVFAPTATLAAEIPPPALNRSAPRGGSLIAGAGTAGMSARNRHNFQTPWAREFMRRMNGRDLTMAWSTSKVFAYNMLQLATGKSFDLATDSFKVALYTNSGTPDNTVTTAALTEYNGAASQWVTGNEVSSVNYTAGGTAVTPVACTQTSNVVTFTSSGSPQWVTVTFTTYGCLVYDTTVSNEGISFNYFGGAQEVTAGTFSVAWNASGIASYTT
jgi:hypothetical protein